MSTNDHTLANNTRKNMYPPNSRDLSGAHCGAHTMMQGSMGTSPQGIQLRIQSWIVLLPNSHSALDHQSSLHLRPWPACYRASVMRSKNALNIQSRVEVSLMARTVTNVSGVLRIAAALVAAQHFGHRHDAVRVANHRAGSIHQ
jgi:hypothetical protein